MVLYHATSQALPSHLHMAGRCCLVACRGKKRIKKRRGTEQLGLRTAQRGVTELSDDLCYQSATSAVCGSCHLQWRKSR